ncbi:MAG TPA: hypothetical protein VMG30_10245 [Acidobacteriota bacterium]|nr:hypothetical protein [Acidobacteriota bacterium]
MSNANQAGEGKVLFVHRTAVFSRNLEDLRQKGGTASMAAAKAEAVMRQITGINEGDLRKKFRFTRHGEYRIKYCGKYDLGCGHRLVFIRRNGHIVFLYVGSHDDCFRWIERNRRVAHKIDDTTNAIPTTRDPTSESKPNLHEKEEDLEADEYEAQLMRRIDEKTLRMIFCSFEKIQVIDELNGRSAPNAT